MRKRELELENHTLKRELDWAKLKIQSLLEELRKKRIEQLGPRSETLSDLQLELLLDQEPGTSRDEVEAEAKREPIANIPPRERKPHPGRQRLPEKLERVEEVIPCPSQHCAHCGSETTVIGYDESEVLDVYPKRFFVRVTRREKRACRCCAQATVSMPELAPRIIEKGLASDAVVVDTVISKYCDHLPLYRQAAILEREAGLEIGRATLDGWVMKVGEMLDPIIGTMRGELLREPNLQADETTVLVQMRDKRGADHQAYLWQYGKPGGSTVEIFVWDAGVRVR
jgi:transposase